MSFLHQATSSSIQCCSPVARFFWGGVTASPGLLLIAPLVKELFLCASRLNFPFLSGTDLRYVLSHEHIWIHAFKASVVGLIITYLFLFFCPLMCFFHIHVSAPDSDAGKFYVVFCCFFCLNNIRSELSMPKKHSEVLSLYVLSFDFAWNIFSSMNPQILNPSHLAFEYMHFLFCELLPQLADRQVCVTLQPSDLWLFGSNHMPVMPNRLCDSACVCVCVCARVQWLLQQSKRLWEECV